MKKASFPSVLSTAIVCYIFWLIISGQLVNLFAGEPSAQVLIAGVVVSIATALFSAKFFIHESPFYLFNPAKFFTMVFYCLVIFMGEQVLEHQKQAMEQLFQTVQAFIMSSL